LLARLNQGQATPGIYGLGIDEATALLVDAAGHARLAEGSVGSAWLVLPTQPAATLSRGQPLTMNGIKITRIGPQSTLELSTHQVQRALATTQVAIDRGVPSRDSLTDAMISRDEVPPGED
jgi:beta-aspartyl-peptidase (threonine type)